MPIWLETTALMLGAYATGLSLGWWVWGRSPAPDPEPDDIQEKETL